MREMAGLLGARIKISIKFGSDRQSLKFSVSLYVLCKQIMTLQICSIPADE